MSARKTRKFKQQPNASSREAPSQRESVGDLDSLKSIYHLQQNNTYINGESIPIAPVLLSLPEGDRAWAKQWLENEQKARIDLATREQTLNAELVEREQARQMQQLQLSYNDGRNGKICALICISVFVALVIVCVMREQTGWGIAGVIAVILTAIGAFGNAKK